MAPIGRVKAYRVLVEGFAGTAEGEKALCIKVGKHKDENVQRQVCDTRHAFGGCHDEKILSVFNA
jgi:hypothetical protein